ncbi:FeoA family protein [Clostridium minihomine]|uniref:FeoA family protein n=1 Tax=Clostridium minihomine TaxID=2045012 RepID=UPI0013EB7AA6|nr:FeoA family protein [Clostridium minihomine]
MRLSLAPMGELLQVKAIWLDESAQEGLEQAGITVDSKVYIVHKTYGDALILGVGERRVAVGEELARKIIVESDSSTQDCCQMSFGITLRKRFGLF